MDLGAGFCVLAAANRVVMNVGVHVCLGIMISEDKGTPGGGRVGNFSGWPVFVLSGISPLLSTLAVLLCTPDGGGLFS